MLYGLWQSSTFLTELLFPTLHHLPLSSPSDHQVIIFVFLFQTLTLWLRIDTGPFVLVWVVALLIEGSSSRGH